LTIAIEALRALAVFDGIEDGVLEAIAACAELRDIAADAVLAEQGEKPHQLHILIDGQVGLTARSSDGRSTVVDVLRGVDLFFLAAVLTDAHYLMGAVALERCRVLVVPAEPLLQMIATSLPLARALLQTLSRHYRMLARQVADLKLRSSTQRLGCYLLALAREQGMPEEFRLPYDKRLLAGRLGMTPENLSRAFAALRDYGVETQGARVALRDPASLERFALPDAIVP
jgi:CRP/FNR family transcriptional activator FtrB